MSNNRNTQETPARSGELTVEQYAELFKALANPGRLRIFLRLVGCCQPGNVCATENARACVGDLGANLGLAPSTVSHHVKELHRAGLIATERSGQKIECWIPDEMLLSLSEFFSRCCAGAVDEALRLADPDESAK